MKLGSVIFIALAALALWYFYNYRAAQLKKLNPAVPAGAIPISTTPTDVMSTRPQPLTEQNPPFTFDSLGETPVSPLTNPFGGNVVAANTRMV